jgi:hypothetical protein
MTTRHRRLDRIEAVLTGKTVRPPDLAAIARVQARVLVKLADRLAMPDHPAAVAARLLLADDTSEQATMDLARLPAWDTSDVRGRLAQRLEQMHHRHQAAIEGAGGYANNSLHP